MHAVVVYFASESEAKDFAESVNERKGSVSSQSMEILGLNASCADSAEVAEVKNIETYNNELMDVIIIKTEW